ncbi:hypothetical protein WR25_25239 [Diploscapter pachys]|uniref:Uncharacterized protein n=1 Tax=Diploscapter pachys TaxID=2018661 RepID=A0A2A2K8V5_9BILA|nr:hypothetical protein WR25_25239 [Diploscapter pachys]
MPATTAAAATRATIRPPPASSFFFADAEPVRTDLATDRLAAGFDGAAAAGATARAAAATAIRYLATMMVPSLFGEHPVPPVPEPVEIACIAHIGRVPRLQRRRMEGEGEQPLPLVAYRDSHGGQRLLDRHILRRQRDSLQQPASRRDAATVRHPPQRRIQPGPASACAPIVDRPSATTSRRIATASVSLATGWSTRQTSPTPRSAKRACAAGSARIAVTDRCRASSGADQSNSSSTSTNTRNRVPKLSGQRISVSTVGAGGRYGGMVPRRTGQLAACSIPSCTAAGRRSVNRWSPKINAPPISLARLRASRSAKPAPSSGAPSSPASASMLSNASSPPVPSACGRAKHSATCPAGAGASAMSIRSPATAADVSVASRRDSKRSIARSSASAA